MRTFYDLLSVAGSVVCGLYFVHAFLAMHTRLREFREQARTEATLRLIVKAPTLRSAQRSASAPTDEGNLVATVGRCVLYSMLAFAGLSALPKLSAAAPSAHRQLPQRTGLLCNFPYRSPFDT